MLARHSNKLFGLAIAIIGAVAVTPTMAAPFVWNVAIDGGNWTDLRWNGGVTGPTGRQTCGSDRQGPVRSPGTCRRRPPGIRT